MFAADLAYALAPSLLGAIPPAIAAAKRMYDHGTSALIPEIINGYPVRGNIIQGWP